MSIFTGAATALVTPFGKDGAVDFVKFEELIEQQITGGIDALVICGTTGEASTLSHDEHLECIRAAVKKTAGRVPVIAGTGSNSTETAVFLSKEAENNGADAVLLVSPYYNKTSQQGMYEHFADTAHAINIPVMLYNIQGRTGCNIEPKTIARLVKEVDNIVAVKEASDNISQIARIAAYCEGACDIYSGNDNQVVPVMALGGKGVVSVLSNLLPGVMHRMTTAYLEGRTEESLRLQLEYIPFIDALFSDVNPIPVKEAMSLLGMIEAVYRKPLVPMEENTRKKLIQEMKAAGLL